MTGVLPFLIAQLVGRFPDGTVPATGDGPDELVPLNQSMSPESGNRFRETCSKNRDRIFEWEEDMKKILKTMALGVVLPLALMTTTAMAEIVHQTIKFAAASNRAIRRSRAWRNLPSW